MGMGVISASLSFGLSSAKESHKLRCLPGDRQGATMLLCHSLATWVHCTRPKPPDTWLDPAMSALTANHMDKLTGAQQTPQDCQTPKTGMALLIAP